MAKLKKWHIAAIVVSSIIVVLGATALTIWAVIYRNQPEEVPYVYGELTNFEPLEWIIGDKFYSGDTLVNHASVTDLFGDKHQDGAVYSSKQSNTLSISGNSVTVKGSGEVTLIKEVGKDKTEYKARVIEGINVINYDQLNNTVNIAKQVPIIQSSLDAPIEKDTLNLTTNFYGNSYKIYRVFDPKKYSGNSYYDKFIEVRGNDILIQDAYIIGKRIEAGNDIKLQELNSGGILISFDGDATMRPSGTVKNCVLENAERLLFLNATDVTIEGCFIRNSADACVSVETDAQGTSNITLKNNVIMNATVSAILIWCMNDITAKDYVTVTIEGFLDIYNWKERSNTQIIPKSQGMADLVNPLILKEIVQEQYNSYFYRYKGKDYIHCAIIVNSSKGSNDPNITFVDNYEWRKFPSDMISLYFKTCQLMGYNQSPSIKPDAMPNLGTMFDELRNGRNDK